MILPGHTNDTRIKTIRLLRGLLRGKTLPEIAAEHHWGSCTLRRITAVAYHEGWLCRVRLEDRSWTYLLTYEGEEVLGDSTAN